MTQRRTHNSPFSFRAISQTVISRTSTKSYPPRTAKGSLPARKDFAIEVKLPPCMSPVPMMPEGKTKARNPLRCKGLRAFHLSKSWSLSWQNADFQQRGRFLGLENVVKSCKNIEKSAKILRFRRKMLELLGGFPPTGINFDSATQLAKTKNHPAGWFPFWSCWADSNRRPHPYQGCALPTELQQHIGDQEGARTLDLQRDRLAF